MDLFGMQVPAWQLYLSMGILFVILEVAAPGFILAPIGVAFMLTSLASVWIESQVWQMMFLSLSLLIMFFTFRKFVHRNKQVEGKRTNVNSMIGQTAIVEEDIDPNTLKGYVRLHGDSWKAKSSAGTPISKGQHVVIESLEGNTVFVKVQSS